MGSALTARIIEKLSADQRVLLLEGGSSSHHDVGGSDLPASCTSQGCALWPSTPWHSWSTSRRTRFDVPGNYMELPCWDRSCQHSWSQIPAFQCKILGGCGVTNGALMQRPVPESFAAWPTGWQNEDLQPYFEEIEALFPITSTPSKDGQHYLDDTGGDLFRSVLGGAGFQWTNKTITPRAYEMGIPHVAARDGVRMSTVNVMLQKALTRPNLELRVNAEAKELLLDGDRAIGVRFVEGGVSNVASLRTGGKVILSAGAFNTPRLLLSSGIGPSAAVAAGGQKPKIESPEVGRGIADHTITWKSFRLPADKGIKSFRYHPPSQSSVESYISEGTGPLTQFGPTLAAFFPDENNPEIKDDYSVEMFVNPAQSDNILKVEFVLMKPQCSSGNVHMAGSWMVTDNWAIHTPCEQDKKVMQGAVDWVTEQLTKAGGSVVPDGSAWPQAYDMNHWSGSCKLGTCVDTKTLLVHGTANVAVADASLLPQPVWGHPALTLKAIALKAAEILAASFITEESIVL